MWIPSKSTITNFGDAWSDTVAVPELLDSVLGQNVPGAPVALGGLASASANIFGAIANNLQYVRDTFITESVVYNVTSVAELSATLDIIEKIQYIQKGAVVQVSIAAGTYIWTETRAPISGEGISGGGQLRYAAIGGAVTIETQISANRYGIYFHKMEAEATISNLTHPLIISNNAASSSSVVRVSECRSVFIYGVEFENQSGKTVGNIFYVTGTRFLECSITADTAAPTDNGCERIIKAEDGSTVYFNCRYSELGIFKTEYFDLSNNSTLIIDEFDDLCWGGSLLGSMAARAGITCDDSSTWRVTALSTSGDGSYTTPYVYTVGGMDTPAQIHRLIQFVIDMIPKDLNFWVKIKLPAVLTLAGNLVIEGFSGHGGLILEANTPLFTVSNSQDSGFLATTGDCVAINNCKSEIVFDSVKLDATVGNAISGISCGHVRPQNCWLKAPTGSGTDDSKGNGVYVMRDSKVHAFFCSVGACNRHGFQAIQGARITAQDCDEEGAPTNMPQQYGYFARSGGLITRGAAAGEYVAGLVGPDSEDKGGKVWNS
jgi:hypothetical protein